MQSRPSLFSTRTQKEEDHKVENANTTENPHLLNSLYALLIMISVYFFHLQNVKYDKQKKKNPVKTPIRLLQKMIRYSMSIPSQTNLRYRQLIFKKS